MTLGYLIGLAVAYGIISVAAPQAGVEAVGYRGLRLAYGVASLLGFVTAGSSLGLAPGHRGVLAMASLLGASWGFQATLLTWNIEPSLAALCVYDAEVLTCFALGLKSGEAFQVWQESRLIAKL
jgi:hypothetical protein